MEGEANHRAFRERAYAMKKHQATRLHYDLRLEWNGVLLSWALPKAPSCRAGEACEATEMEDHRRENLLFEGVHETGPIMLWDCGTWEAHPDSDDIAGSLLKGSLRFTLYGGKLKGGWTLTRKEGQKNTPRPLWLLCKQDDSFARGEAGSWVFEERPNSVSTGRTMEEIVREWFNPKNKNQQQTKLFDI
jgi:bifunctional non-homologous end joining protein LigD